MSALASATAQAATQPPGVPTDPVLAQVWALLDDVADPEIPVVSLKDLGILRDVRHGTDEIGRAHV